MPTTRGSSKKQHQTAPEIHVDDRFLQDHLRDVRAEMAWRRELEFRLLQFLLIFYPILGGAMVQLYQGNINLLAFLISAAGAALLIWIAFAIVADRINHEHRAYMRLAKQVQMIWSYFGLFEPGAYMKEKAFLPADLLDEKKGYGQGPGYSKTLSLIRWITIAMTVLFIALCVLKTLST